MRRSFPRATALALALAVFGGAGVQRAAAAAVITPITPLAEGGLVSARGGVVALTQVGASSASLLVGKGGAVPTVVAGVGTLPRWAYPHVGTNREGDAVVIYPRCSSAAASDCDLWAYDVGRGRATALAGVNSSSADETEGAMAAGSVAFTRWTAAGEPALGGGDATTRLMYKPAVGATRLVTRKGGQQIALAGNQIAQVRDGAPTTVECGQPAVELLTTAGLRRTVRTYRCGLDGHAPFGLGFVRGRLLWAMHGLDQGHYAQYVLATRKTIYEDATTEFVYSYAPLRTTHGVIVRSGDWSSAFLGWTLDRISGLTYPRGR